MNGKITISRIRNNKEDGFINIQFEDKLSCTRFMEAKMTLADFASALTGLGYVDCEFELHPANVGKLRQSKTELIPFVNPYKATKEEKEAAVNALEVDGWKGYRGDLDNHHRYNSVGISVSFTRFVEAE